MRRIDYRSGLLFAAASVPGAVLGALTTRFIPRRQFDALFGLTLILLAAVLVWRTLRPGPRGPGAETTGIAAAAPALPNLRGRYNLTLGLSISAAVGFLSSLLGVGGGIMHVPALTYLLHFPVHIATATSHFVLAITAAVGTIVHIATGAFHAGVRRTIVLSLGVILGAPIGARLSRRIGDRWIVRALALGLLSVGVRLVLLAMHPAPGAVP
jgi:hypothetical protein